MSQKYFGHFAVLFSCPNTYLKLKVPFTFSLDSNWFESREGVGGALSKERDGAFKFGAEEEKVSKISQNKNLQLFHNIKLHEFRKSLNHEKNVTEKKKGIQYVI